MNQHISHSQMDFLVTNFKITTWVFIDSSPSFGQLGVFLLGIGSTVRDFFVTQS